MPAQALLKRSHEAYWLMVLLEEISEGFSSKLLKRAAGLFADCPDRLPSIVVKLDALAGHYPNIVGLSGVKASCRFPFPKGPVVSVRWAAGLLKRPGSRRGEH
jgi:hypothetical protein